MDPLPLLDRHSTAVAAPPAAALEAARGYARRLAGTDHGLLGRLLGTDPPSGFTLDEDPPADEVGLSGRHRFSRYRLVFAVAPHPDGAAATSTLSVLSYAAFPGARGGLYRALLLGTHGHVLAVRRMLRAVRDEAERDAPGSRP